MATAALNDVRERPTVAPWTVRPESDFASGRGWSLYLAIMALMVPTLQPTIPVAQLVIVDGLNFLAILIFAFTVLARRPRLDLPLIVPVMVIAVGSFIAITNAESASKCALTLLQDTYLYLWFLMMVALLKNRGDQRGVRIAWMWAANIAGAIGLVMLLTNGITTFGKIFGAKGFRAVGLFNGPNELADYMMMSLFVVLSLKGQANRFLVWGSLVFQMIVLIATKSNGAMSGWILGMAVWTFVRMYSKTRSIMIVVATASVVASIGLCGWLMMNEWGMGESLEKLKKQSFLGRFEQSAEGREQIWQRLVERYAQTPLGIGPGNSSEQRLTIGLRERRKSQRSKEAHNDYLGYLVERGPLGLLGFVMLVVIPFAAVARGYRKVADRAWHAGTGGAIAAALAGGLMATTFHSLTMEKLHFRHYWLFLAIVFAFGAASGPRLALAAAKSRTHRNSRRKSARPHASRRTRHRIEHGNGITMEER